MRKTVVTLALLIGLSGCHQSTAIGDDTENDTHSDATDSDSLLADTNTAGGDSDSFSDSDSFPGDIALPLTFVIENHSLQPVVLRANSGLQNIIQCSRLADADDTYYLGTPWCMTACDEVTPEDPCMILCEYYPGVLVIDGGDSVEISWNGFFRGMVSEYCSDGGGCYSPYIPVADNYAFSVIAYPDFECAWEDSCLMGQEGITWGAEATGEGTTYQVQHELPSHEDIHLIISDSK